MRKMEVAGRHNCKSDGCSQQRLNVKRQPLREYCPFPHINEVRLTIITLPKRTVGSSNLSVLTHNFSQPLVPSIQSGSLLWFIFVAIVYACSTGTRAADVIEHSFGDFDRYAQCLEVRRAGSPDIM